MLSALYADILRAEGFHKIGELHYRLNLTAWWNPAPDRLLQVVILSVGRSALIKADKAYHLVSVTAEGETWARDVGPLHSYLETHFPELRISFSFFRDLSPELAQVEARRRMMLEAPTQPIPTVEQVARLQRNLEGRQQDARATDTMIALLSGEADLLTGYLHQQTRTQSTEIDQLRGQIEQQRQRLGLLDHLQREYRRKGSAGVYSFGASSNLQVAQDPSHFRDALRAVVKELTDLHRYQVMQRLGGSRLNIQVKEAHEPVMTWIEQWFGGALTPMQLRRLGPEFDLARKSAEDHVIVTPDVPIVVNDHVRHAEKHLAAHVVSDVLRRLDKSEAAAPKNVLSPDSVPPEAMPLSLGCRVDDQGKMIESVAFPLTQMVHVFVSGTTGSGKSFFARVLVEEAARQERLAIVVLDPRNQSVGLLVREDRPKILDRYNEFGMNPEHACGFDFNYYAPGLPYAAPLPDELAELAHGRSVVSLKGLDDQRRCATAADVLNGVFEACSAQESETSRLLIVVDEAHLFTRKRVEGPAKVAAARTERALDRIAREGRKFGVLLVLISQSVRDFGYELATIRQMTTTKVFLRNSDRETGYAGDIIGDGRQLAQLPTGTALVHNANWGVVRIRIRPPHSKVAELRESEIRQLVGENKDRSHALPADARRLFDVIKQHGNSNSPLNLSRAAALGGISSKRKLLDLIEQLERVGVIRTRKLPERGQPRVIELVQSPS